MIKCNRFPFIVLLIIHTILLFVTFAKKKDRKRLIVLLFSNVGLAYIFEYLVLNLFPAYQYKPRFLKRKMMDNIIGAILSQAVYVPISAVFISTFKLRWKGIIFFTVFLSTMDLLFVRLKVYKHFWWKTMYTALLLPVYFLLSNYWYRELKHKNSFIKYLSMFFMMVVTKTNLLFVLALNNTFKMGTGLFRPWKEHFIFAPLYAICCSAVMTVLLTQKTRYFVSGSFIFMETFDQLLLSKGLLKVKGNGFLVRYLLHGSLIISGLLYKWLYNSSSVPDHIGNGGN